MIKFRLSVLSATMTILFLIGSGTWIFHYLEDWTWAQSFYFATASLTTVGYGDITPTTDTSRVIAAIYILIGVGIVIAALSRIGTKYLSTQESRMIKTVERRIKKQEEKNH